MSYVKYQEDTTADVIELIKKKSCQPILFVGSGFSRRYCGAPNWETLLTELGKECPEVKHEFAYYIQSGKTMPEIGSIYATAYKEWAWGEGKKNFPVEFFSAKTSPDAFIKYMVAKKLSSLGPKANGSFGSAVLDAEIAALKEISPHAVITTNYDTILEPIFKDYQPVIGQQVIRHAYMSIGEIFKIHGCVSDPLSLTLTEEDYEKFSTDKKYLSAKLFTFFVEHPLIFIGYAAGDKNIKNILQEIDHMLPEGIDLVDNIYFLEWKNDIGTEDYPSREKIVDIGEGKSIRIKSITTNSFEWVFKAFKSDAPLEKVNVKLLRSISHRIFDLVRKDVAKNTIEINFQMLSHAIENPGELPSVYGVAAMSNPALLNLTHPYMPNEAALKMGFKSWHKLYYLMDKLGTEVGFQMRESDNKFHVNIAPIRRYSQDAIDLLIRFRDGKDLPDLTDPLVTGERIAD